MIENSGYPDQTYDAWSVEGISAYCGGLWLAALSATSQMASLLQLPDEHHYFQSLLARASDVYEKNLWTGEFYKYDNSGAREEIVMSYQLARQWYARSANLRTLHPEEHVVSALSAIFRYNFRTFAKGEMGVVNGFNAKTQQVDRSALQSSEVWVGTCYALIANMLQEGLVNEAWEVFESVYECIYRRLGYWFQTPEAWDEKGKYRSYAYMRPLAVWAIQWAVEKLQIDLTPRSAADHPMWQSHVQKDQKKVQRHK